MDNELSVPLTPGESQFTGELYRVPRYNPREFEDPLEEEVEEGWTGEVLVEVVKVVAVLSEE